MAQVEEKEKQEKIETTRVEIEDARKKLEAREAERNRIVQEANRKAETIIATEQSEESQQAQLRTLAQGLQSSYS